MNYFGINVTFFLKSWYDNQAIYFTVIIAVIVFMIVMFPLQLQTTAIMVSN